MNHPIGPGESQHGSSASITDETPDEPDGDPLAQAAPDPGPLGRRIQYLLDNVRRPDGKRYTYREVVAGIRDNGGPSLSIGYLSQLVTGVRANPMMDAIQGLARFFDVPISYFDTSDDTREANMDLKLLAALKDTGVQDVALHTVGLSEVNRQFILSVIDYVRDVNGLPPIT